MVFPLMMLSLYAFLLLVLLLILLMVGLGNLMVYLLVEEVERNLVVVERYLQVVEEYRREEVGRILVVVALEVMTYRVCK